MSTIPFQRQRTTPLPPDIAKKLPSNDDAERSVLGALLLDNARLKDVAGYLHVDEFFDPRHSVIFDAFCSLALQQIAAGVPLGSSIDLVILSEFLFAKEQLDKAGGAPYLASLVDGVPRVSNIRHYAQIVKEKSALRRVIRLAHSIQEQAFEGTTAIADLVLTAETSLKQLASRPDENPAVVVGFKSLLERECAPIEYAIEPLLSRRGTGMVYGWRGTGKSWVCTQMAVDIAMGAQSIWGGHRGGGGHWTISRPFRQLYVYGEMDESEVQERVRTLARMRGSDIPSDEQLGTMCMDYQKNWRPKISTPRDRKFIEDRLIGEGYEGLWLDNLSTLWPVSKEAEGERDAILADWYADLNQRGIWVIWLHHAGKSGEQRGGSEKEDMLSFVAKLRRPANYKPHQQLRVEVHIEKNRHKCLVPKALMPFEISLVKDANGISQWVTQPALAAQRVAAFENFKNHMPTMLVAQEVGVSRATAYRWRKEFDENPNPDFHLDAEE